MQELTLPNLGDGVAAGDVLKVLVKPGESVKQDQAVLELETDKATVEVPSTVAGVIKEVKVKAGEKVKPGQVVLVVDDGASGAAPAAGAAAPAEQTPAKAEPTEVKKPAPGDEQKAAAAAEAPAANAAPPAEQGPPAEQASAAEAPSAGDEPESRKRASVVDINQGRPAASAPFGAPMPPAVAAPASPAVRRLAREIGVDINVVTGSGPRGRISLDDVKAFSKRVLSSLGSNGQAAMASSEPAGGGARPGFVAMPLPDLAKWGEIERKPMTGIRRKTAEHLSHAWNTIPHVTQFDKADITDLEQMRKRYRGEVEKAGGNLTVTAIAVKVVATALRAFPQFNASVDAAGDAIVYKKYVHVGVAVDTENGLLVPVIRDADQKNLTEISVAIQQLADKAKARKLSIDEMSGGSMSISNLGGLGGTAFTPIVNWPEVAILGISRGIFEPVWNGTTFEPRQMLPLSLSYDHRLIDGADAIRFLRWVAEALEQPFTLALRG